MNDFKDGQTSLKMESEYKSIQYIIEIYRLSGV